MRRRVSALIFAVCMLFSFLPQLSVSGQEAIELDVAVLESAYGTEVWQEIVAAYEEVNPNVTIVLTQEKNLEDALTPRFQSGDAPDVVMLGLSREKALPETLIKENALANLTDVHQRQVPGEEATVADKLLPGFTDSTSTNPYNDGETYLFPMFYSPTGLFYNKGLFEEQGWQVPRVWDDMWTLADQAAAEGIHLFTYPTAGYLDTFFASTFYNIGGQDFFDQAMAYQPEAWESDAMKNVFDTLGILSDHTEPTTVANANPNDFTRNQQLILDNQALFMPNGTWIVGEMAEAPRADNFQWAMAPIPTETADQDQYAYTFIEHIWIPAAADHIDAGKDFIAFMYSDRAAEIFANHGAVQPVEGLIDQLPEDQQVFYGIYEEGILPAMGSFVSTEAIPGVDLGQTLYFAYDSVVADDLSVEDWYNQVLDVMSQFREVVIQ